MRSFWVVLPLALNSAAVIIINLDRKNWPEQQFWSDDLIVAALVFTGVLPVIQTLISELGERARRLRLVRENQIRDALAGALAVLATYCDADWRTTAVQAFALQKRLRWTWKVWRLIEERQVRLSKVRLASIASSGIEWTKGKGLIGRCWQTKTPQWNRVNLELAPFAQTPRSGWDRISPDRVYGLSYDEYQSVKDKYGLIAAVPILDASGRYVGCITMDTPVTEPPVQVDKAKAMEFLASAAKVVGDLLTTR